MMPLTDRKRLIREIEEIPEALIPKFQQILTALKRKVTWEKSGTPRSGSLRGIWRNGVIDEGLFRDAKRSLFPFDHSNR
jgi:hypothetical protein